MDHCTERGVVDSCKGEGEKRRKERKREGVLRVYLSNFRNNKVKNEKESCRVVYYHFWVRGAVVSTEIVYIMKERVL